jgi:DNA-binding transcriptional regulator LsrR (DeoR family)
VHSADLTAACASLQWASGVATAGSSRISRKPEGFYADNHVQKVLEERCRANMAIMGIGAPRQDSILVREGEIVQWLELEALQLKGAVGDINLRYFDERGVPVESDLDNRVVGLSLAEIRNINQVIGIAGGATKIKAIHGALNGKLIDVLVTDQQTAQSILAIE